MSKSNDTGDQRLPNVRALNVGDLIAATDIIDGLLDSMSQEEIEGILSGSKDKERARKAGFTLVTKAFRHCRKDLLSLIASICDLSDDEMRKLPASAFPKIVNGIFSNPENADFFAELRGMLPDALSAKASK